MTTHRPDTDARDVDTVLGVDVDPVAKRPRPSPQEDGHNRGRSLRDEPPTISKPREEASPESDRPRLQGDDYGNFVEELLIAERTAPKRLGRIPRLTYQATRLTWNTSRFQTSAIMLTQVVVAGFAALQVVLGGIAVRELLRVQDGVSLSRLVLPLLLLALVSTATALSGSGSSQFGRLLGARVQRVVSGRVLDVTTEVDLVTYDDARFHDQLSRVLVNVPSRPFQVVTCVASLVGGIAGVTALTVSLFVIQPILVPILLLGGVPLWYLSRKGGRLEFDFAVAQTASLREREYLEHTLSRREDAAELRAYGSTGPLRRRWDALYDVYLAALRVQVRRRYVLSAATAVASGVILVLTLLLLILLIDQGVIGFAQAASAAVAIRLLSSRLQQLIAGLSTLFESALFLDDYNEFLGRLPTDTEEPEISVPREQLTGLSVRDVGFRYPQATVNAVTGVSIDLRPGEIVALVGENGSGKTTLAKILAGLYAPSTGSVRLNDRAVSDDERERIREHVALVLQDFTHYALSAGENISFGRPEDPYDANRVEFAARRVGADSFLTALPEGYDTRLSKIFKGGRELSLGQWQRVALARAFYRDAPIVILDEPTAALDPRAEAQLYDSMRSVLAGRTVVLITHRLASVRGADRICVLEKGSLVEQGSHDELITLGGLYAELVSLQQNRHVGSHPRPIPPPKGATEPR